MSNLKRRTLLNEFLMKEVKENLTVYRQPTYLEFDKHLADLRREGPKQYRGIMRLNEKDIMKVFVFIL